MKRVAALAAVAVAVACAAAVPASATAPFRTTVTVATSGLNVLSGTVGSNAKGKLDKVNFRKRCRAGRLVDFTAPHGAAHVKLRTDSKGLWTVTVPEIVPGTYKAFVTARGLPGGHSCTDAVAELVIPYAAALSVAGGGTPAQATMSGHAT